MEEKSFNFLSGTSKGLLKIQNFLRTEVGDVVSCGSSSTRVQGNNLDLLWGTVNCFPYLLDLDADSSLLADFIDALDWCLVTEPGTFLPSFLILVCF